MGKFVDGAKLKTGYFAFDNILVVSFRALDSSSRIVIDVSAPSATQSLSLLSLHFSILRTRPPFLFLYILSLGFFLNRAGKGEKI